MKLVVDASVALKWFLHVRGNECDSEQALNILTSLNDDRIQLIQPPHFIAEMAAVLAREKPDQSQDDLQDLHDLEIEYLEGAALYATAIELSIQLQHHLFDTLYHAVALNTPNTTLITADRRYYDKAKEFGSIVWLADWSTIIS